MILDQYGKRIDACTVFVPVPPYISKMIINYFMKESVFGQISLIHELRKSCGAENEAKDTVKIQTKPA